MSPSELFQTFVDRLKEARLYVEQGLSDGAAELFAEILLDLENSSLAEKDKEKLRSRVNAELEKVSPAVAASEPELAKPGAHGGEAGVDPSQSLEYGLALMDSQFWEEAILEFKKAATFGENILRCWELCGDCATHMERWEEAIRYYELIYSDPSVAEEQKKHALAKITKCSQMKRTKEVASFLHAQAEASRAEADREPAQEPVAEADEFVAPSISSLDKYSVNQLFGQQVHSWCDEKGACLTGKPRTYRVTNLLHVGLTSIVVELEAEETGEHFAGQSLIAPFSAALPARALARWVYAHLVTNSVHLVQIVDLACTGECLFIVREHLPVSLAELFSGGALFPIPIAIYLGYQILEGLGDLHLHMGGDGQIRNMFHLDLRPSRILLQADRPVLKINNGGLWRELERYCPEATGVGKLPLPFLAYRASEQFRSYLSRRKPPVFTDIYLWGALFYEMLTGNAAFRASSFEEYEIQHCEHYPTPPKVWRPEIPEEVNDLVMKCLECDPMKRWRSTTQIALILEKSFSSSAPPGRDGSYEKFIKRVRGGA